MAKPKRKDRWANIDVFGLLNGVSIWDPQYRNLQYVRRPFDSTLDIRDKILRTGSNPPNVTKQGLVNGLSNEFGYDVYNVEDNTVFQLNNVPVPSGDVGVQDIYVYYRERNATGNWTEVLPQVWGDGYAVAASGQQGFIVWQNQKYTNVSGIKNFTYQPLLEIMQDLPDNQDIKVVYWVRISDENRASDIVQYTDMSNLNDPNDLAFLYRKKTDIPLLSGITVYTLNDLPSGVETNYYDEFGRPKELWYDIKQHVDKKFKHKWSQLSDSSVIWDVHKGYGSGQIPHYYDAEIPKNDIRCIASGKAVGDHFSGYAGGVEELSDSLYLAEIVEQDTDAQNWYIKLYPGSFYVDGIPFRLFENPSSAYITLVDGEANIPSGLERGMYTIMAASGYYNGCTTPDPYLSGFVYEDYWYPTGENGDTLWSYIYRRRPYLTTAMGYQIDLELGQYNIDFDAGKIYCNSTESGAIIIWDNNIVPSGRIIQYDVNPLNDEVLNLQKYFMYLTNKE